MTPAITQQKGTKEPPAGPAKILGSDDVRLPAMQSSINELRDLFLSCHDDQ